MPKLSYNARRMLVGIIGLPAAIVLLSDWFGWNWLGEYSRSAHTVAFVALIVAVLFVGPSLEDMRAERQKRRAEKEQG